MWAKIYIYHLYYHVEQSFSVLVLQGQVTRVKGNFGFIQPDDGAEEVFFMPRGLGLWPATVAKIQRSQRIHCVLSLEPPTYSIFSFLTCEKGPARSQQFPTYLIRKETTHWQVAKALMARQHLGWESAEAWAISLLELPSLMDSHLLLQGFEMVNDEKTGRPRADHIFPEAAEGWDWWKQKGWPFSALRTSFADQRKKHWKPSGEISPAELLGTAA